MKYSEQKQSAMDLKERISFVPIALPIETERLFQTRRFYPLSQQSSRNGLNKLPWFTERDPWRSSVFVNSKESKEFKVPTEWELKLAATSSAKRNQFRICGVSKSLTSAKSISTTKTSLGLPSISNQKDQNVKKLISVLSCQYVNKPTMRTTRETRVNGKAHKGEKSSIEIPKSVLEVDKKKIKWYYKKPRVIINKYYEHNFTGSTEKAIKRVGDVPGFINRISILFSKENKGEPIAIKKIESNKVKNKIVKYVNI